MNASTGEETKWIRRFNRREPKIKARTTIIRGPANDKSHDSQFILDRQLAQELVRFCHMSETLSARFLAVS